MVMMSGTASSGETIDRSIDLIFDVFIIFFELPPAAPATALIE